MHVLWIHTLCDRCPHLISGRRFRTWCDSKPFVDSVKANKSNLPSIAFLLGILHRLQSQYSFDLDIEWVDTKKNHLADALSRDEIDVFFASMSALGASRSTLSFVQVRQDLRVPWSLKLRQLRRVETALRLRPDGTTRPR